MSSIVRKTCFAMIIFALFVIIMFSFISVIDESVSADDSIVRDKDHPEITVGNYQLDGNVLTITANPAPNTETTEITLDGFDNQALVREIIVIGFINDISSSFDASSYTMLQAVKYKGAVDPIGDWIFDLSTNELSITASEANTTYVDILRF